MPASPLSFSPFPALSLRGSPMKTTYPASARRIDGTTFLRPSTQRNFLLRMLWQGQKSSGRDSGAMKFSRTSTANSESSRSTDNLPVFRPERLQAHPPLPVASRETVDRPYFGKYNAWSWSSGHRMSAVAESRTRVVGSNAVAPVWLRGKPAGDQKCSFHRGKGKAVPSAMR
jgi:hypothetical protein